MIATSGVGTTILNFELDQTKLLLAINTPDHIGAIVRIHTELDEALIHVVKAMVPPPIPSLNYAKDRIECMVRMGLPELRVTPAIIINRVRNRFVHKNQQSFEAKDVSKLYEAVAKLYGGRDFSNFVFVHRKRDSDRELPYADMDTKEKFCFLGFLAIAGVAAIENDFEPGTFKRIA
jgi:tRNA U38,U39,U40 pseudouridine synthase TruA